MHDPNSNIGPNSAAKTSNRNGRRATDPLPVRETQPAPEPLSARTLELARRIWRPAGTLVAFALALVLTWHVINGKHGLNVWLGMRTQDKQLQRDIHDLDRENDRLRDRIEHLKSDPDTIMIEARQKLHYAKPDEVIVALPAEKSQPADDQKK
jgi:cell division protein FtsB